MSVPLTVFTAAGFDTRTAAQLKDACDAHDLLLEHLATGAVTQQILKEEFGIEQLGKRLKILTAAKSHTAPSAGTTGREICAAKPAVRLVPTVLCQRPRCTTAFGQQLSTQLHDTYAADALLLYGYRYTGYTPIRLYLAPQFSSDKSCPTGTGSSTSGGCEHARAVPVLVLEPVPPVNSRAVRLCR